MFNRAPTYRVGDYPPAERLFCNYKTRHAQLQELIMILDANNALVIGEAHINLTALFALSAPFVSLLVLFFFAKSCLSNVLKK